MHRARWCVACAIVTAIAALARPARAQRGERVGTYFSYTWLDHAYNGWDLGADMDIGPVVVPSVHLLLGLNYLKAQISRHAPPGVVLGGAFHDLSATADVQVALFRAWPFEPFVGAGLGLHFLGNTVADDPAVASAYGGTKLGGQFFGGTAIDLTRDRRWSAYIELRRIAVRTVGRTALRLGAFVHL